MTSGNRYVNLWSKRTLEEGLDLTRPDDGPHEWHQQHNTQHGVDYLNWRIQKEQKILDFLVEERDTHEPGCSGGVDRERFQHMLNLRVQATEDKIIVMTDQRDALAGEKKKWE